MQNHLDQILIHSLIIIWNIVYTLYWLHMYYVKEMFKQLFKLVFEYENIDFYKQLLGADPK